MGRRSKQADLAVMFVRCDGAYAVDVAGESHYQEAITECVAAGSVEITSDSRCSSEFNVRLVREPDNQYDANAVAVTSSTGRTLGHLPRAVAGEYAPVLDRITGLAIVECAARAYGRRDGSQSAWIFGIWLDLPDASELSQALAGLRSGAIEEINEHEWRYVPAEGGVGRMVAVSCPACGAAGEAAPGVGGFRCRSCQNDVWVINCRRCHEACTIFGSAVGSGAHEFRCGNCRAKNIVDKQRLRAIRRRGPSDWSESRQLTGGRLRQAEKRNLVQRVEGREAEAARRTGQVQAELAALTNLLSRTESEAFEFSRLKVAPAQLTFSPGGWPMLRRHRSSSPSCRRHLRGLSAPRPGSQAQAPGASRRSATGVRRSVRAARGQRSRASSLHYTERARSSTQRSPNQESRRRQHDDVDHLEAQVQGGRLRGGQRVLQRGDQLDQVAVRARRSRVARCVLPRVAATRDRGRAATLRRRPGGPRIPIHQVARRAQADCACRRGT